MTKLAACLVSFVLLSGCGGDDTGGGTGSGAGGGGTGGEGSGGGAAIVNGCAIAAAEDHTAESSVTITVPMGSIKYEPSCIKIKAGATVTFETDFTVHPLVPGVVEGDTKLPDEPGTSPLSETSSGNMATFNIPDPGSYGYYCDVHATVGMTGAIHAIP